LPSQAVAAKEEPALDSFQFPECGCVANQPQQRGIEQCDRAFANTPARTCHLAPLNLNHTLNRNHLSAGSASFRKKGDAFLARITTNRLACHTVTADAKAAPNCSREG